MTTAPRRTPWQIILSAMSYGQKSAQWRLARLLRDLEEAGYEIRDKEARFTRDQVENAWNAGAELVLQDPGLELGDRDADLVYLVCNAIGTCLDNPGTDSLDAVINANYAPNTEPLEDEEENAKLSDEAIRAACVDTVKGWINQ